MKKIMFLMAAAMIVTGGMTAAFAQEKPAAKTEQPAKHAAKAEKMEHKKTAKHHHAEKKQTVKKAG